MVMATSQYSLSLFKHFFSSSLILFILISCFLTKIHGLGNEESFHTVEISSFLPASVCSKSKDHIKRPSTLELFHKHGPCHKNTKTKPSLSQILAHDETRSKLIQARLNSKLNPNTITNTKIANLPAQSDFGEYVVKVGLGTPTKTITLVFDTGSDLTWTQCQPCVESCYRQKDPIFNPLASTTYSNVSCVSATCSQLISATGYIPGCNGSTCVYGIKYGDSSFSIGFFGKDTLTISPTDVFPNFLFGCGENNQGLFGDTAGIIGLGRNALSIVSQTAYKYGEYFSYCLPSTSSSTGYLSLGKSNETMTSNLNFTLFSTSHGPGYYFIDIVAISVGGIQLPISQSTFQTAGTIIDSGTVITRLPPDAYCKLSTVFQLQMSSYPRAPSYSILDICYDFSNYTVVQIPAISFTFSGNVKVDLHPTGILFPVSPSTSCLAFASNGAATDLGIFGNTQQKTLQVVYDVVGGNLGFGAGGCN